MDPPNRLPALPQPNAVKPVAPTSFYLTSAEAAHYLRCSVKTLHRWTATGLPHYELSRHNYRFTKAELDQWITRDVLNGFLGTQAARDRIVQVVTYRCADRQLRDQPVDRVPDRR